MHASLHDNPNRIHPKVPGINAQPLQPSIGTDHWRTQCTQRVTPQLKHRARPLTGAVDLSKVPSNYSTGRERVELPRDKPKLSARKRRAIARADHAARLSL